MSVLRTCLITGGAGNLACQLSWRLASRFDEIVLCDLAQSPVTVVPANVKYKHCDLVDQAGVACLIAEHRPNVIFHLASLLSASCEHDLGRAWNVNTTATLGLFESCLANGVGTVVFPSSLATYGGQLADPLEEDAPQWPDSLYGVTKVACERLGLYFHRRQGLDFRCLRLPAVISRFAPTGAASAYSSRAFIESVECGRFTFPVRPSTQVSLIYVEDALEALVRLAIAPAERLSRRVYNIQAISPSAQDIADCIRHRLCAARLDFNPDPVAVRLIESWPRRLQDGSARHDWQWGPQFDLQGMADHFLHELKK